MLSTKHFRDKMTGVSATGLYSLRDVIAVCFGIGTIVAVFRQVGTVQCDRERLKTFESTSPNSAAQSLRKRSGCHLDQLLSMG